jgi:transposase
MQAYSVDLRQRIVDAVQVEGATIESVSERFCVSPSSVKRYKHQFQESGSLAPKPRPGRPLKIKPDQENQIEKLVASRTDWSLQRLCDAWQQQSGVSIPFGVMARTLARLKISYKKRAASPKKETRRSGNPFRKR